MKVLHVTAHDNGGAGEAAYLVYKGLQEQGFDSKFLCMYNLSSKSDVCDTSNNSKISNFLFKVRHKLMSYLLNTSDKNYSFFDKGVYSINDSKELFRHLEGFEPDIIIFYWISTFINPKVIHEISQNSTIKTFWYLTDMAPLTGGCHYTWECEGYLNECGRCPALHSYDDNDLSRKIFQKKKHYLEESNVTLISPNSYVSQQVQRSGLFKTSKAEEVFYGVDSDFFHQGDKAKLRKRFNITMTKKVIFFGATNVDEKRKGVEYFIKAVNLLYDELKSRDTLICIAGNSNGLLGNIKLDVLDFGFVDYSMLRDLYVCSDLAVIPSIEDTGPIMSCEVMMTGTPLVAFDIGISGDLIDTQTGYIAEKGNYHQLAEGIMSIIGKSEAEYEQMTTACRARAVNICEKNKVISDLIKVLTIP